MCEAHGSFSATKKFIDEQRSRPMIVITLRAQKIKNKFQPYRKQNNFKPILSSRKKNIYLKCYEQFCCLSSLKNTNIKQNKNTNINYLHIQRNLAISFFKNKKLDISTNESKLTNNAKKKSRISLLSYTYTRSHITMLLILSSWVWMWCVRGRLKLLRRSVSECKKYPQTQKK